jgi:acetyltransferase-like isoleucine patch superfamily enzyme
MQPNMRSRPITIDDGPERPVNSGWPNPPYASSRRGHNNDKDPVHGLPIHGNSHSMRDSYDRPINSMSGSGMHSMPSVHGMQPSSAPHVIMHTAQQALRTSQQMDPSMSFNNVSPVSSQRQQMMSGELYIPFCNELEEIRERCANRLNAFNNNNHVSREQRMDHLKTILSSESPTRNSSQEQRIGERVIVDLPFTCDYGYNITFGSDVRIGSGCHISDPRDVSIGSGTELGVGVRIIGKVAPFDPNIRGGRVEQSKARAIEISIGKDVYIGAHSVIQPDEDMVSSDRLHIGDGSYIKPMSFVNKVCHPLPRP